MVTQPVFYNTVLAVVSDRIISILSEWITLFVIDIVWFIAVTIEHVFRIVIPLAGEKWVVDGFIKFVTAAFNITELDLFMNGNFISNITLKPFTHSCATWLLTRHFIVFCLDLMNEIVGVWNILIDKDDLDLDALLLGVVECLDKNGSINWSDCLVCNLVLQPTLFHKWLLLNRADCSKVLFDPESLCPLVCNWLHPRRMIWSMFR